MKPVEPLLLVASQFGQTLDFFDTTSLTKLETIEHLIAQPHEMVWDSNRRLVYLTHTYRAGAYGEGKPKSHEISVIDPATRSVVGVIDIAPFVAPHDIDYDSGRDLIYVGIEQDGERNGLLVIDARTRQVVNVIPVEAANVHWVCLTPSRDRAYLTHKEAPVVTVVDLVAGVQTATVASPGGAEEVDASPDGRYVFVASPMMSLIVNVSKGQLTKKAPGPGVPTPRVLKIDTATNEIVGQTDFPEYVSALRVAPDGRILVAEMRFPDPDFDMTAPVFGVMHAIDPDSMTVLGSVDCQELPFTIRASADSSRAYVANLKSGTVTVVDLNTYAIVATLENNVGTGFGGTHGMCLVPDPMSDQ